jgi:hypothetical protein
VSYSSVWNVYISCAGKVYHLFCFSSLKEEVGWTNATNFSYGRCNAWDKLVFVVVWI